MIHWHIDIYRHADASVELCYQHLMLLVGCCYFVVAIKSNADRCLMGVKLGDRHSSIIA